MPKIVRYTGPRRGGITQIGSTPVQVPWDTPVELADELADPMLAQYPGDWSEVTPPSSKRSTSKKPAAKPAESDPTTADESPAGEEVHLS